MTEALRHLSADPRMAAAIAHVGTIEPVSPEPVDFPSLARNIVGQQPSGKAADGVWRRVVAGLGEERPGPGDFLKRTPDDLRALGLSRAKAGSGSGRSRCS